MKEPENRPRSPDHAPGTQISSYPCLPRPATEADAHGGVVRLPLPAQAGSPLLPDQENITPRRSPLWYALYFPQLADLSEEQQRNYLNGLAALAENLSSTVSFHDQALVFEVRSSLKYFGGLDNIHARLGELIGPRLSAWQLPERFLYAVSPTVTGSLLLARAGSNKLVYRKDNLRSALGQLPASVLQLDREQHRRLHTMGVRRLRDIWRLPTDGLRKRFGSDFVNQLRKALGKAPEATRNHQAPPAFISSYELPHEVENLDRLLPVMDELVAQLCDFLRLRDLGSSEFCCALRHEQQGPSLVNVGLRQPSRRREHLMLLLETHFSRLSIPAPVIAVSLEVKKFDAFTGSTAGLLPWQKGEAHQQGRPGTAHYNDNRLSQFMEQLQARLGEHCLKTVCNIAEHCPEYASALLDCFHLDEKKPQTLVSARADTFPVTAAQPRPFWLLPEPQPLTVRHGRLYYHRPLRILSGPERIEARWWSGGDQRRDYYVAEQEYGGRLWIYHEKIAAQRWFLHGLFA